jgi:hypothetical protein
MRKWVNSMSRGCWYRRISTQPLDPSVIVEAIAYFDAEAEQAHNEANQLRGKRLVEVEAMLPGICGYRWEQFKELESIGAWLAIRADAAMGARRRHYVEHYNRALSDRMVEKFAEADQEVLTLRDWQSQIAAVRFQFEAVSKQLEWLHWQLTNITKLVCAGMQDAVL